MAQILCFARSRRKLIAFSSAIASAGHTPIRCHSRAAVLRRVRTTPLDAIVVEYCRGGRYFRDFLKAIKRRREIPVVIVSWRVVNAFQTAGRLADLYLEGPVAQAELAGCVSVLAVADGPLPTAQPSTASAVGTMPVQQAKLPTAPAAGELLKPAAAAAH